MENGPFLDDTHGDLPIRTGASGRSFHGRFWNPPSQLMKDVAMGAANAGVDLARLVTCCKPFLSKIFNSTYGKHPFVDPVSINNCAFSDAGCWKPTHEVADGRAINWVLRHSWGGTNWHLVSYCHDVSGKGTRFCATELGYWVPPIFLLILIEDLSGVPVPNRG